MKNSNAKLVSIKYAEDKDQSRDLSYRQLQIKDEFNNSCVSLVRLTFIDF